MYMNVCANNFNINRITYKNVSEFVYEIAIHLLQLITLLFYSYCTMFIILNIQDTPILKFWDMLHYVCKLLCRKGLNKCPCPNIQPCYCEMVITVVEFYGPYCNRSFQIERGDPSHELDGLG